MVPASITPSSSYPSLRQRIIVALSIGILMAGIGYFYSLALRPNLGDIGMPLCMARVILEGGAPYTECRGFHSDGVTLNSVNPVTTAIIVSPLLPLPPLLAVAVFIGLSTALLSFGLTRTGFERLLVLSAFPYWHAIQVVQWSPLLFASALLPWLLPLTLAKPHVGAPIALTRLTWKRCVGCIVLLGLSLLVLPTWPLHMLNGVGTPGDYRIPILTLPLGPVMALALIRWKSPRARLLLLFALVPQRLFYDIFLLWLIPQTRREILVLSFLSWISYFLWFFFPVLDGMTLIMLFTYLPCLLMVLREKDSTALLQKHLQKILKFSLP